ncbi:MAG: sigma-70 family RNA polymerase sigma factor [Planctomycetes bacterium]|nr:sigma-70 family RNA polymerase sigma factor [Planctomycetota bacterium]
MSDGSPSETEDLLARWHAGDQTALDRLLERDLSWIESRVRRRLGPLLREKLETADVVQETVVEFLRYSPRFLVTDRGEFRALLARIAENAIRAGHDRFTADRRSIRRERSLDAATERPLSLAAGTANSPSRVAERSEERARLAVALELLGAADREILLAREWHGESFARIAQDLGILENAARMRYERAMGRLAGRMRGLESGKLAELLEEADRVEDGPEVE